MTKHHPTKARRDYLPAAGRDSLLPLYDLFTAVMGASAVHQALIHQAGLADGQRVLEIGCGTGKLTALAKRSHPGIEVVGSDPDPLALARAERKARGLDGIRFERAYAQELPYPEDSFDRVLSSFMFHHLDQDTKEATAAEIARVLRPGGSLHMVDFSGQAHTTHGMPPFLARRILKQGHVHGPGDDDLPRLFAAAGLSCAQTGSGRLRFMGQIAFYRATPAE